MYPWLVKIAEQLQHRIKTAQLHHGLLFVADQGVGEEELISHLTKTLVCTYQNDCGKCKACLLYEAHSHPDIRVVISEKPSIGVDLIRSASEFVNTTSQLLGNKVVVIEHIESMTESASNSLLKTLEEPSQNTFLLLTTNKPNQLLPTITSRCEKIRLPLPSAKDSLAWLSKQTEKEITEDGLSAFSGSPIAYLDSLLSNKSNYEEFNQDLALLNDGALSGLALAEKWKNEAAIILSWTYQKAVVEYSKLVDASTNKTIHDMKRISTIESLVADCHQANKKVSQAGINKSLILQSIFNKFQASNF
jgi:DNA polymerase-3 subunit delta'